MTDVHTTVIGNLADDPSLRFTASGAPVANFRVLSTPRNFDKQANEWKDGETLALNCSLWRDPAENVTNSLHKGDRVIVQGKLKQRSWEKDGEKRTSIELDVIEIGPSLRYATAKVTRTPRQGGQQGGYQQVNQAGRQPMDDPWGTAQQDDDDQPPF